MRSDAGELGARTLSLTTLLLGFPAPPYIFVDGTVSEGRFSSRASRFSQVASVRPNSALGCDSPVDRVSNAT